MSNKILVVFHPSVNNSIFIQVIFKPNSNSPITNQTQPRQTKLIHTNPNYTKPNQSIHNQI